MRKLLVKGAQSQPLSGVLLGKAWGVCRVAPAGVTSLSSAQGEVPAWGPELGSSVALAVPSCGREQARDTGARRRSLWRLTLLLPWKRVWKRCDFSLLVPSGTFSEEILTVEGGVVLGRSEAVWLPGLGGALECRGIHKAAGSPGGRTWPV